MALAELEGEMKDQSETQQKANGDLTARDWVAIAWGLTGFLLVIILLAILENWIINFLHAPIGIKDNPPEPSIMVQIAQFTSWPIGICFGVASVLKILIEDRTPKEAILIVVRFALYLASLVVLVALGFAAVLHRELIPGTFFLWKIAEPLVATVSVYLFCAVFLILDGVISYSWIRSWNNFGIRGKIATVLAGLSTISGLGGFIGMCANKPDASGPGLLAIVLFVGAYICMPQPAKESSPEVIERSAD